jgi:hypothetical protein
MKIFSNFKNNFLPYILLLIFSAIFSFNQYNANKSLDIGSQNLPFFFGFTLMLFYFLRGKNIFKNNFSYMRDYYFKLSSFYILILVVSLVFFGALRPFQISSLFGALIFSYYIVLNKRQSQINNIIQYLFFLYTIFYVVMLYFGDAVISFNGIIDSFIVSNFSTESPFSLAFCLFTFYFFRKKDKILFIIALLLTILSFKRIAIGGLFLVILISGFYSTNQLKAKRSLISGFYIFSLGIIVITTLFTYGFFDEIIKRFTGLDADIVTMGRQTLYSKFIELDSISNYIGRGIGYIQIQVESDFELLGRAGHLHSDLLKNFIEFGSIFYIVWIIVLVKIHSPSHNAFLNLILFFILMTTDNVFVYQFVLIPFYLINFYFLNDSEIKNIVK